MAGCICGEFKVSSLVDNGVEKEAGVACVGVNGVVGWVCSGVETVACVVVDGGFLVFVFCGVCCDGVCVLRVKTVLCVCGVVSFCGGVNVFRSMMRSLSRLKSPLMSWLRSSTPRRSSLMSQLSFLS